MNRNISIIHIITLLYFYSTSASLSIELQPININFNGIETKNDTIAVTGDYGSLMLSYDNAVTWWQIKVFETGTIVKLFFEDNRITTFNSFGKIGVSTNSGKSWDIIYDFQDTVLSVMKLNDGYLVRLDDKLVLLSDSFQNKKETILRSDFGLGVNANSYMHTMTLFKDEFIISMRGMKLNVFNDELNFKNSINLGDFEFCKTCTPLTRIFSDKNFLYVSGTYTIGRTSDLKQFEKIYETKEFVNKFILHEGIIYRPSLYIADLKFELYKIIPDSSQIIAQYKGNLYTYGIRINDFIIRENKVFFVGDNKLIIIYELSNNSTNIVSEFSGISLQSLPDAVNDSTFLFYYGYYAPDQNYGTYFPMVYKTDNRGLTFKNTIDYDKNPNFKSYYRFDYKYFDSVKNTLYFGGWDKYHYEFGGFMVTEDFGKNFNFKMVYGVYFRSFIIPNLQKNKNNFITAINGSLYQKDYTTVFTFNNNFDIVTMLTDSNFVILYLNSKDTNTFLFLCRNSIGMNNEIKYTTDKGTNWEIVLKYDKSDSLLYYQEYETNGTKYLYICLYNIRDSILKFDALNIEERKVHTVYSYKVNQDIQDAIIKTAFYSDGKIFYLAVRATLFYIDDIKAMNHKNYIILPNNGRITRTFKRYGDIFCARYSDNINPDNLYWIKFPDKILPKPLISTEDFDFDKFDIKQQNYKSAKIKIKNLSDESELIITGYNISNDSVFIADLPVIDSLNPLIIKQNDYYEYSVVFKPKKAGIFKDSIMFQSNADENDSTSIFLGEAIDTVTSVIENDIEISNYLYAYPPYPLPAKNEIRSLIYWDTSIDIELGGRGVYNIYGLRVSDTEKIRIDKLTNYSGYLVWDCSGVESGIYFININHGTENRFIKVIVTK